MRSRRVITLAILFACGQTTAMGDRAQKAEVGRAPVVVRPKAHEEPVATPPVPAGPLDNAAALKRFFAALGRLDERDCDRGRRGSFSSATPTPRRTS